MLRSMRIGSRLVLSFSVLQGFLFVLAMVALAHLGRLTTVTQTIVDVQAERVALAHAANQHAQSAANCLLQLLQASQRERRIPLYAAMDADMAAMDDAISAINQTLQSPEDRARLQHLSTVRNTYDDLFRASVETIELEGTSKAREHFDQHTRGALNALLQATLELAAQQQNEMHQSLEQLRQGEANARTLLIVLTLAALFVGSALAWAITRSIVQPVGIAVQVADNIAHGDLHQPVPEGQTDEMGQLLTSLRAMRDSIASREDKILKLAYADTLTGLPNRTLFLDVCAALPEGSSGAVAVLDIDRFALINNALGHPVGDLILREIGTRLDALQPRPNLIARLWADKFAFLFTSLDRAGVEMAVNAIVAALQQPIHLDDQRLDVGGSVGIALFPQDGRDPATLLRRAEMALPHAKRRHVNFAFAEESGNEPVHEHLSLIGEMREALARDEFVVYYQPKLHLGTNSIRSVEALLRWRHPARGLLPPGKFIPFAEQTGFIREITPWLLQQVIRHAAEWQRLGHDIVPSVNLSTLDLLDPWLIEHINSLLQRHQLHPQQLCLEITESALMAEPEIALKHLHQLAALGLKLSIDDYGSGQASLAYLKTLPVHELKIDREFITAVDTTPRNAAIVRSTIVLCHELGLDVVAEGAERNEELNWLRNNRCDTVQGYVVARPMALAALLPWVMQFTSHTA